MTICTLGKEWAVSGPTRPPDQVPSRQDRGGVALPELQGALRVGDVAGGRARGARRQRSQRRDSAAALTQTGTLMWRRRMLTASTPAASSRATGGRQMALAQRPSRRTPLEGNHRGHRVATRQGGGAAMPRGLNHQPSWAEGFHGTRATAMQRARQHWASEEAGEYGAGFVSRGTGWIVVARTAYR